ncbi:MAG: prolipoprotein diacylglyceryl transferase, partial [bacterium]|nr:prolipoprotein diacylglyceryl transferase [bacterium]
MLQYILKGYNPETILFIYDALYFPLGFLGIVLAMFFSLKRLIAFGYGLPKVRKYLLFLLIMFPLGFAGSRAAEIFYYHPSLWSLDFFTKIMVSGSVHTYHGALITGTLVICLIGAILKFKLWHILDTMFIYVPMAHVIGRTACFFIGCCWGEVVYFSFLGREYMIPHPVPLYEICINAALFIGLRFVHYSIYTPEEEKKEWRGMVFCLYLI